uniref:Uncharacterized protein n=1 Tax=Heterorhabditis bacteriophora TaxID=37862 RepID=A0A1I7WV97_HETBA
MLPTNNLGFRIIITFNDTTIVDTTVSTFSGERPHYVCTL